LCRAEGGRRQLEAAVRQQGESLPEPSEQWRATLCVGQGDCLARPVLGPTPPPPPPPHTHAPPPPRTPPPHPQAYAMTEAAHQMTSNPLPKHGPHKPGTVGKPQGSVKVWGGGEAGWSGAG
jgi:hypothetical protein